MGYDQAEAALGEPSRVIPGEFGGPVDPFNAPWQTDQIVSVGTGGSLTIRFDAPVRNAPTNPHGLDFLVFGSSAFVIVNGDYSGGGVTDGSLFGDNAGGASRVSVSTDGTRFFMLDPTLAPGVDGWFPTDGQGDFRLPVDPALREADFAGRTLAGIRELYAGSGGGIGYDLAWARDEEGRPVTLESVEYVRIDVLAGRAEIDAFTAVPEPEAVTLCLVGIGVLVLSRQRRKAA